MRVATFNILHGRSPVDDRVDVERFAKAVHALDADVLALQEVDRNQPRSQHADLTAVAAEAMGAVEHRFVAALGGTPGAAWMAATGEEQPDAAAYGNSLLSRYPVSGWQVIRLPQVPAAVPMWFRGSRRPVWVRDEPRVAVAASVQAPGGELTVAATHLSFVRWWNGRQLRMLRRSLESNVRPLLLMGDLNMPPSRARALTRLRSISEHVTFPADAPREQIDHILLDGDLTVTGTEALATGVSDHLALVADFA